VVILVFLLSAYLENEGPQVAIASADGRPAQPVSGRVPSVRGRRGAGGLSDPDSGSGLPATRSVAIAGR
jgi:hypothetical protein